MVATRLIIHKKLMSGPCHHGQDILKVSEGSMGKKLQNICTHCQFILPLRIKPSPMIFVVTEFGRWQTHEWHVWIATQIISSLLNQSYCTQIK